MIAVRLVPCVDDPRQQDRNGQNSALWYNTCQHTNMQTGKATHCAHMWTHVFVNNSHIIDSMSMLAQVLNGGKAAGFTAASLAPSVQPALGSFQRSSPFLQQQIFNSYHW